MRCPRCSSENTHIFSETNYKGFGFFRGCLGWLIFGPIGALCGACGMGKGSTRHYFLCNNCGNRFRA